jgi:hypothetical protein
MWQPQTVELALFRWHKWRNSIVKNWEEWGEELDNTRKVLELVANRELERMGFPALTILKIYWISCLGSNYNFDYPITYAKIVTSFGSPINGMKINPGVRVYPPAVINDKDLKFESEQLGFPVNELQSLYSESSSYKMLLQKDHELVNVLNRMRGRPRLHGKRGSIPLYPDRLAVQCATLKDKGMSYVEIAEKLHLRITTPYSSKQSDTTTYLVHKGRKLLKQSL